MAKTTVKIEGMRQLRSTLRKTGGDIQELKKVNLEAANVVKTRGVVTVPYRSGALQRTIRTSGTQTTGIIRAGNNRRSKSGVRYAPVIHWGWKKRNIKPQPWLSTAAKDTEPTWVGIYYAYLSKVIKQIKGI